MGFGSLRAFLGIEIEREPIEAGRLDGRLMDEIWIDTLIFAICAVVVWFLLRRVMTENSSQQSPLKAQPTELQFLPTPELLGVEEKSFESWLQRQLLMARLPIPANLTPLLIVCASGLCAALTFVLVESVPASVVAGLTTLATCLLVLIGVAQWRIRTFRKQLPLALDIMAGAVASGESLKQSVGVLATTMQEPAKTEFVRCRNQLDMGLSLRATMQSLAQRVGSLDVKLFATTLAVHRETGGKLNMTLKRMSKVIRSRFDYEQHLQTTTGMGRLSVIVVVSLAWIIFAYFVIARPEYGRELWETAQGQRMLMTALLLEVIGIVWAFGLMRAKY